MATPVRRPAASVPATTSTPSGPTGPIPIVAPFGWILSVSVGIVLLLATWIYYPDDADGMWAGYRGDVFGIIVLTCAMSLRTSLPKRPAVALIGLCGAALVLCGVFIDDGTKVAVTELITGALLLVSAGLQAGSTRD